MVKFVMQTVDSDGKIIGAKLVELKDRVALYCDCDQTEQKINVRFIMNFNQGEVNKINLHETNMYFKFSLFKTNSALGHKRDYLAIQDYYNKQLSCELTEFVEVFDKIFFFNKKCSEVRDTSFYWIDDEHRRSLEVKK